MWWHGRGNSGGSCLPEDKKANMWPGRKNSGGSWLPEDKKANMWPGRGIVVAHGRLPSPTRWTNIKFKCYNKETGNNQTL